MALIKITCSRILKNYEVPECVKENVRKHTGDGGHKIWNVFKKTCIGIEGDARFEPDGSLSAMLAGSKTFQKIFDPGVVEMTNGLSRENDQETFSPLYCHHCEKVTGKLRDCSMPELTKLECIEHPNHMWERIIPMDALKLTGLEAL